MSHMVLWAFRCEDGHQFDSFANEETTFIPCEVCAKPAKKGWYGCAPGIRTSGEPLSAKERRQAITQFGDKVFDFEKKAWKVETKADLQKLLKREGKVAVSAREFDDMVAQHGSIQDAEARREPTKDEKEKRRAELKPVIDRAKARVRNGEAPVVHMPHTDAALPSDVKSVLPESTKAATGVKETR